MARVERSQRRPDEPENVPVTGRQEPGRTQGKDFEGGPAPERDQWGARRRETKGSDVARRPTLGLATPGSPFSFMRRFSEEMDRLFDDFGFGGGFSPAFSSLGGIAPRGFGGYTWAPAVELITRGNELVIRADVPGVSKEDLQVELSDGVLTLRGERRREQEEAQEGRYHTERSYGSFVRAIRLPEGTRPEDARATFRDGVLEVVLPLPEEKRGRRIEIQS